MQIMPIWCKTGIHYEHLNSLDFNGVQVSEIIEQCLTIQLGDMQTTPRCLTKEQALFKDKSFYGGMELWILDDPTHPQFLRDFTA